MLVQLRGAASLVHFCFHNGSRWKLPWKLSPLPRKLTSLPLKRVDTSMEVLEASMEVVEASMEVKEASTEVVEASVISMEASIPPWNLLLPQKPEASVGFTSGSFRGSAQKKLPWKLPRKRISVGFRGLQSIIIYFYNLPAVYRSFHYFHGSFHCFHCLRGRFHGSFHCFHFFCGKFHGSRFRGSNGCFYGSFEDSTVPLFEASTTSIGACLASMEASRSLHRFRESFHLQRNSLPCAMEASMEAAESFHFLWVWKLPRLWNFSGSSQYHFRGSFQGAASTSTGFHVVPLTSTCVHFVP